MELLVIFVVALLVLGPTKLPEAGRQVGRALAEFRRWSSGVQQELHDAMRIDEDPTPPSLPPLDARGGEAADAPAPDRARPKSPSAFPESQSFS